MLKENRPQFELMFDPALISVLASRYSFQEDSAALNAGEHIRSGHFTRENLERIFEWKTNGRGRSRLRNNDDEEIADALSLAVTAKTDRSAVGVLVGLSGVQVPVASAVLTAINPKRLRLLISAHWRR